MELYILKQGSPNLAHGPLPGLDPFQIGLQKCWANRYAHPPSSSPTFAVLRTCGGRRGDQMELHTHMLAHCTCRTISSSFPHPHPPLVHKAKKVEEFCPKTYLLMYVNCLQINMQFLNFQVIRLHSKEFRNDFFSFFQQDNTVLYKALI